MRSGYIRLLMLLSCLCTGIAAYSQTQVVVNLAALDGVEITPGNILGFQVQSTLSRSSRALIKGQIRYRSTDLRIDYELEYTLQPGVNQIGTGTTARFTYSTPALKELFELYHRLPQGIYEYCVTVIPDYRTTEVGGDQYSECLYHKSEDIFLINLVDPENDAKLYEYNPMLSWVANYPFAAQLQYRIRVAEIKKGQTTVTAITRNNPIYDDKNLSQTSIVYPVYAKPLVKDQPYAWTVDAYYKGILLGGAEPWKFTIIEDSLLTGVSQNQSYYEFEVNDRKNPLYAIDTLKLKYRSFSSADTLQFALMDKEGRSIKLKENRYGLQPGLNYIDLPLESTTSLKHLHQYKITIATHNKTYEIPFTYVRSIFLSKQNEHE